MLACLSGAGSASANPAPVFHVSCGAQADGDGSQARPLNSLAVANRVFLRPGAQLLFERGTKCRGTLAPRAWGTAAAPVTIGAYGRGPRPVIAGRGEDAVLIRDVSHAVVRGLEVTNRGGGGTPKRGITVVAERTVVNDVAVRGNYVHHVGGDLTKGSHGSAGIQGAIWGQTTTAPQRFQGLVIERNRVANVSRSGIRVDGTTDVSRPDATGPWPEASTRVLIQRNRVDRTAGDGIVANGTLGAKITSNVVSRGNLAGSEADGICNAGIWTFHANWTVIERNEVFDYRWNGCDGTGFDVDYDQDGTIVQFNYSHDNEGGFILLCGEVDPRRADVRYNLSVDDGATIMETPCRIGEGIRGGLAGVRIYNNTIVSRNPRAVNQRTPLGELFGAEGFEFRNNLVYATEPSSTPLPCGPNCSHNLFFNMPASGTNAVAADPLLRRPRLRRGGVAGAEAFEISPDSPAAGAGTAVPYAPRLDYFGSPVPAGAPSIGIDQPG